jgi:hypothetical protein
LVVAGAKFTDETAMPGPTVMPGGEDFAKGYLAVVVKRAEHLCKACEELPNHAAGAYPAHKIALRILVDCAKPRLAFFSRVSRPELVKETAKQFDEVLWRAAVALMGLSEGEASLAREQAAQRPKDGGIGLQREERRCAFAYLGSWLDVAGVLTFERDIFEAARDVRSPVGQRLRQVYEACATANEKRLPPGLPEFLLDVDPVSVERKYAREDGSVRWQALLMRGKDGEDAQRWLDRAPKKTKRRLKEVGGAWIFAPDVHGCLLAGRAWKVAMRLRFGLSVRPAMPEGVQGQRICQIANKQGQQCRSRLDDEGHHACACTKAGQQTARHTVVVRELVKAVQRRGVWAREEQWVDELTERTFERGEDGEVRVKTKEARLDMVVRDGSRLWWVDFTCFHPFIGTGPRIGERTGQWSLEKREGLKHKQYPMRKGGRREVPNGQLVPIVANSYGSIGGVGRGFLTMLDHNALKLGRDCARVRIQPFVESLVVYLTAQNVIAAYGRVVV